MGIIVVLLLFNMVSCKMNKIQKDQLAMTLNETRAKNSQLNTEVTTLRNENNVLNKQVNSKAQIECKKTECPVCSEIKKYDDKSVSCPICVCEYEAFTSADEKRTRADWLMNRIIDDLSLVKEYYEEKESGKCYSVYDENIDSFNEAIAYYETASGDYEESGHNMSFGYSFMTNELADAYRHLRRSLVQYRNKCYEWRATPARQPSGEIKEAEDEYELYEERIDLYNSMVKSIQGMYQVEKVQG